ncbi:hypothetical protein yc1106_03726 [Curvularia clavata]|uniref:Uncharacterized protein n=1 Tax=Curvularia clavata TaxID=95742 RepID=A0A9Q8Z519_CURCL|nr:hypothetical protein yc1106_03726 [Curvularia clavata]
MFDEKDITACYSLNGQRSIIDGKTHASCNMTAVNLGGYSTCCPIGDLCLTNGMCKKKNSEEDNWYMRRACTDLEWKDPACSSYCAPIEPERNTSLIFHCLKEDVWCCAYVGVDGFAGWSYRASVNFICCSIDDLKFKAEKPVVYAIAEVPNKPSTVSTLTTASTIQLSTISQDTSASATNMDLADLPTEESSPTHEVALSKEGSSSGLGTGAKVGLGVGISVGLLALTAIGAFIWIRRKKQSTRVNNLHEIHVPTDNKGTSMDQHGTAMYSHELPSQVVFAELPAHDMRHELPEQRNPAK